MLMEGDQTGRRALSDTHTQLVGWQYVTFRLSRNIESELHELKRNYIHTHVKNIYIAPRINSHSALRSHLTNVNR